MRRRLSPAVLIWFFLAMGTVWACRYSVRDTGFVDLGSEGYRLELGGSESLTTLYRQSAAAALLEANVTFAASEAPDADLPTLHLSDPTGRRLELGRGFSVPALPADVARMVESVVASPAREEIHREALRGFAVAVLVEGTDAAETERAAAVATRAIEAVARLQPAMPKPVDLPAHLLRLPIARQQAERVLLWGLGLDPDPSPEPRIALVYGRGRRLGTPLEGPLITRTALQERLVLIGQDCECDLDRAWLQGPVIPGRWDADLQQIAARTLGFDPENPMVRSEVARIVLRGDGDRRKTRPTGSALALGYTEESIDIDPEPVDSPAGLPTDVASTTDAETAPSTEQPEAAPTPAADSGPDTPSTRVAWSALFGALAAAGVAGIWLILRGGGRG